MKSFSKCAALVAFFLLSAGAARADEFSLVPSSDAAYKQLAVLGPLGWTELRSLPKSPLTRYEIATETARAIAALRTLRSSTRFYTPTPAMRPGIRAVHDLADKFRPELHGMGIDAAEAMRFCDEMIKGNGSARSDVGASDTGTTAAEPSFTIAPAHREPVVPRSVNNPQQLRFELPLSKRLRFESMVSKLSRDAADPFGDTNDTVSPNISRAGVALSLNSVVSMHAFGGKSAAVLPGVENMLATPGRALNTPVSSFITTGGGLSVALPRGVQLRGNYERLAMPGGGADWKRVGGEVEMSAWRNRLSLRANWSRLLPNDARLLPSSAGGLDVGLDVSERLRLTLLYRQLFSDAPETAASRVVSGGININF